MTKKNLNKDTEFGKSLIEGLEEAVAWKRGKIALESVNIDPMPAKRIKQIRQSVASSVKQFEIKFGIPAATINNWEQGRRKPDPAARLLLKIIEKNSKIVESVAKEKVAN